MSLTPDSTKEHEYQRVNFEQLTLLMRMSPTLEDTAAFFGVSTRSIERTIKDNDPECSGFVAFRAKNAVQSRMKLIRDALKVSDPENRGGKGYNVAMHIFALKNMCGWKDKLDLEHREIPAPKLAYVPKSQRKSKDE